MTSSSKQQIFGFIIYKEPSFSVKSMIFFDLTERYTVNHYFSAIIMLLLQYKMVSPLFASYTVCQCKTCKTCKMIQLPNKCRRCDNSVLYYRAGKSLTAPRWQTTTVISQPTAEVSDFQNSFPTVLKYLRLQHRSFCFSLPTELSVIVGNY